MPCPQCQQSHSPEMACQTLVRGAPVLATSTPVPDNLEGQQLGSFRLKQRVGSGGMGTVYLAEHTLIGSQVAVKVLHPHLAAHPSLVKRFYAEARAVNLIGHENIVKIYDLSCQNGL